MHSVIIHQKVQGLSGKFIACNTTLGFFIYICYCTERYGTIVGNKEMPILFGKKLWSPFATVLRDQNAKAWLWQTVKK